MEMAAGAVEIMSRRGRAIRERSVSLFTSRKTTSDMFTQMKLNRSSCARWESMHECMSKLWKDRDVTISIEQIYRIEPDLLHSVLPQCVHYILHAPQSTAARSLERFLLQACSESTQLAFELYWLLLAQPLPPPASPSPPISISPADCRRSSSYTGNLPLEVIKGAKAILRSGSFPGKAQAPSGPSKSHCVDRLLQRVRAVVEQPKLAPVLTADGQLAAGTNPLSTSLAHACFSTSLPHTHLRSPMSEREQF